MCKEVEKVLEEIKNENVPTCTVEMDGETRQSNDFVCVMSGDNGDASLFYYTDALSLGMSMKLIAKAFVETLQQLTEEERQSINEVLGDAFVFDKPQED